MKRVGRPPHRIAGLAFRQARTILRLDRGDGFSIVDVLDAERAARLHLADEITIRRVLADLVAERLLVQETADRWRCTPHGHQLQGISRERLTRAKAEDLLAEVISRAEQINADESFARRVNAIVVFGSFLSDRPRIGDIDLAIDTGPRFEDCAEQERADAKARARAVAPRNLAEELSWPTIEVMRALKRRSPVLELHELQELDQILKRVPTTPFRVVFGAWPSKTA